MLCAYSAVSTIDVRHNAGHGLHRTTGITSRRNAEYFRLRAMWNDDRDDL